jgi:tRNA (guanine6-N2)-methyltransferase
MKKPRPLYLAQTQPGFEAIAAGEIEQSLEGARIRGTRSVADKNGMVLFDYPADALDLFDLRTIEDVFVVIATLDHPPPTRETLKLLESLAARASTVEPALALARQIQPGRGGKGKLRFRVVARQVGQTAYRRVDAQRAAERGIAQRGDHRWQIVEEGAIEFWLTLLPNEAILALRLSDERMRHREYKIEHLPASLRPSAAAALVWLTQPADDDVFLDPMCGAATTLIERAHMGRYKLLLGGDLREEALEVARGNIGPRYKPIELRQWDARNLPLDAGSVSAAAVNLPFGKQLSTPEENRALYPAFLRESARVLHPGARLVALTGDRRTFEESLRRAALLTRRATLPVMVLGHPASVYTLEKV